MRAVESDASWDLIDPHNQEVIDTKSARKLWEQMLEARYRTGEPYLHFIDTAIRALPQQQKDLGLAGLQTGMAGSEQIGTMSAREQVSNLERLKTQASTAAEQQALQQDIDNMAYQVFQEEQDYVLCFLNINSKINSSIFRRNQ